jgi:hypothetical protein
MDKETEERINRPIPYQAFPKMKHHPDGRTAIVNTESEESALGTDWCPNPTEALKVRAERDAADEKRLSAQLAKGKA